MTRVAENGGGDGVAMVGAAKWRGEAVLLGRNMTHWRISWVFA